MGAAGEIRVLANVAGLDTRNSRGGSRGRNGEGDLDGPLGGDFFGRAVDGGDGDGVSQVGVTGSDWVRAGAVWRWSVADDGAR